MDIRELTPWRRNRAPATTDPKAPQPQSLHDYMDRWFDDMGFGFDLPVMGTRLLASSDFSPRLDVVETEKQYRFSVELPGLSDQDIDLSVDDGVLTIKGEKKTEIKENESDKPMRVERHYGAFARAFTLPKDADEEAVEATFDKGVLTIVLGKTEAADQRRKIEINSPTKHLAKSAA